MKRQHGCYPKYSELDGTLQYAVGNYFSGLRRACNAAEEYVIS